MTAKIAPANAAAPITAAVFLLRFFFTALQISMAQTTQTAAAASAMTSVSHNHDSSYNIIIRSPYLSLGNWKLLFHIHSFVKSRLIYPLLSPPLWVRIFQQVRLLCNLFQPHLFFHGQLLQVQFEPFTDKSQRRLLRVAALFGGFLGGLQKIFQWVILRDAEKIVLMCFPQVEGYLVYILLYHIAAKAVIVNMGGDKLP